MNWESAVEGAKVSVESINGHEFLCVRIPITKRRRREIPTFDLGSTVLSLREKQVYDLIMQSYGLKEIGVKLFISERTVKYHAANIWRKIGMPRHKFFRSGHNQILETRAGHTLEAE